MNTRLFYVGHSMSEPKMNESASESQPGFVPDRDSPAMPRPGSQLAARREELGMTIEQAANQLNLAPRQVYAIESDNFAALPGKASIRGFIRAYAKLLKIDAAPLLTTKTNETSNTKKPSH